MEYWESKADEGLIIFLIRAINIRSDLILLNPLFQHASIPSFCYVGSRHSQFSLTWPSFRPVGPTARREDQVFIVRINGV